MKKILSAILAFGAIGVIASCSKKSTTPTPTTPVAQVKFMNAYLGSSNVAVAVNGSIYAADSSLPFLSSTGYQGVASSASAVLAFELLSTRAVIANTTQSLTTNSYYSAFITGNTPVLVFTADDLSAPGASNAKVRFVNLSPDTLNESVLVDTMTIATSAKYQSVSSFVQVPAGVHKITAADPAHISTVVTLTGQTFAAGKIYTIVLTGTQSVPSGTAALSLTNVSNN